MLWLKAVDVLASAPAAAILAFGDSITDGTCTTVDGHDRWEDWLAVRLEQSTRASGDGSMPMHFAILNEGIGGNTITREGMQPPPDSPTGLERLDRDALSHYGVKYVILFMGTNDIRRDIAGAQVIAGMQEIIKRLKVSGLKVIGVTIIPRHNLAPTENNSGWDPEKTRIRHEVNQWIRSEALFDALIDFDQVVRDPADPDLIYPPFNCGDGIHPSPRGYYEMGNSVPLDLFRSGLKRTAPSARH
jgi:lysophospholipase L1-like esterase